MIEFIVLSIFLLLAIGVIALVPSLVLPVVCCYSKNYTLALFWLKRYFRHDMALYTPFDLVYLHILNGRVEQIATVYRAYLQKGNIGSEFFVQAWVAGHTGEWQVAETALMELRKYTIMNDVDLDKLAGAIARRNPKEIDTLYLVDMNGKAFISPSLFRVMLVSMTGALVLAGAGVAVAYLVMRMTSLFV